MGLAYGIGGLLSVPPAAIKGVGVPSSSFKAQLGQVYFDITDPASPVEYVYNGISWSTSGSNPATTTTFGTVLLTDNSQPVATKVYADNLAIAGAPVATETTPGIAEIATQVETDAGTDDTRIVTPLKLANFVGAGGFAGSFTDLTATGTVSFTGATGGITMTSATASSFGTTGAGIDLTLDSASGRVIINGEEAAANAITLLSAAGGIDADAALQINIASSQNAADAIRIVASAGGIDVDAVGAAGEDINITNTGGSVVIVATENVADSIVLSSTNGGIDITAAGAAAGEDIDILASGSSVNITSTENNAGAVVIQANGGGSERVTLLSSQGIGADSINLESTAGGITLSSALATADGINLTATGGGIDVDAALQINIASSQNAVDAIRIVASAGGIDIDAVGAATEDINITNTGGSVVVVATEADAGAITLTATTALGGIDVNAGTGGMTIDSGGVLSLDSAGTSNFTVTGAFDLSLVSSAGSVNVTAGEDAADAIVLTASAGGIDILATGEAGQDIDIINTGGSVNVTATEDVAEAIYIRANGGTSETLRIHADQGTGVASVNIGSDVGGVTISGGLGNADAINLTASTAGGGIDIDASTGGFIVDTTGAVSLDSAAASNFTVTGAFDLSLISSAGSVNVTAGEDAADAIVLTASAGGIDILATGAAGQDIDIVNTGGSVNITATEDVTDAIVINASGAASALQLDAGTGSVRIGSGLVVAVTDVVFADSPYTVLGTDYLLSVDTSGGAVTVTLPAATALTGRTFVIRDTGGAAAASNITIGGGGTNLVGGGAASASKTISAAYSGATVYSNGATWNYVEVA